MLYFWDRLPEMTFKGHSGIPAMAQFSRQHITQCLSRTVSKIIKIFNTVLEIKMRHHSRSLKIAPFNNTTHATQRMHGLWRNQKTVMCNTCTQKTQHTQSILFFACVAFFVYMHCVRCVRCIWQLENRPLSPFSAFWWRWLCFNVWHT